MSSIRRPVSLGEVAQHLGISKPAAYRLLATLAGRGFVAQDPASGRYRLGLKVWSVGNAAVAQWDLPGAARETLEWLAAESGESAHVAVYDHGEVIWIAKHDSPQGVRVWADVGTRAPVHATAAGKAMVAYRRDWCAEVVQRGLIAVTDRTITDSDAFLEELAAIRRRGWATNVGEWWPDACAVAAPIRNSAGEVAAAVSISVPLTRWSDSVAHTLGLLVVEGARRIAERLGYLGAGLAPAPTSDGPTGAKAQCPPSNGEIRRVPTEEELQP